MDLYFSLIGAAICVLILIGALYVFLKYLAMPKRGDVPESWPKPSGTITDEEFVGAFTSPLFKDGKESLDLCVDSLKLSLEIYGRKAWVESAEEAISARKSAEEAEESLLDVLEMVETGEAGLTRRAGELLRNARYFIRMAEDIEKACDAMIEGKEAEARPFEGKLPEYRRELESWDAGAA